MPLILYLQRDKLYVHTSNNPLGAHDGKVQNDEYLTPSITNMTSCMFLMFPNVLMMEKKCSKFKMCYLIIMY